MGQIDREGTFIGKITESSVGESTNGFPQFIARLETEKYYAVHPDDLKYFSLTEPGWVDWPGEQILTYQVLFGAKGETLSYQKLQDAVGWDGLDFGGLVGLVDKYVLFRVEGREYQGKTKLEVTWIDAPDASPERTLKAADPEAIKALTAKFITKKATVKPAGAGKPAVAGKAPAGKPATSAPTSGGAAPLPPAAPAATAPAPVRPGKPPAGKKAPAAPPPVAAAEPTPGDLPATFDTRDAAWEYVQTHKGANEDTVVTDAWISTVAEVSASVGRDEERFTPADFGVLVKTIAKDLAFA